MTSLADLGAALHGAHWIVPVALSLEVSERTVRRWQNGQNRTPAWAIRELTAQLRAHHARLGAMLERRDEK